MREVYFDDLAFKIDLDCSDFFFEEYQGVVVCMEVVLHFFFEVLILKHLLFFLISLTFFYCGEEFLDYPLLLFFLINNFLIALQALSFSFFILVKLNQLIVVES
jgi:hypothetical protein